MVKKYKNIWAFLVIAFFLLTPFAMVKTLGSDYEIFPAALFPGGADRKQVDNGITLDGFDIYGIHKEKDEYVKLNLLYLFKRIIHIHHMIYFVRKEYFGALDYDGIPPSPDNPYKPFSNAADKAQTVDWLKRGLREQHCKDSILLVRFKVIHLDSKTKKFISETVTDERVLKLY